MPLITVGDLPELQNDEMSQDMPQLVVHDHDHEYSQEHEHGHDHGGSENDGVITIMEDANSPHILDFSFRLTPLPGSEISVEELQAEPEIVVEEPKEETKKDKNEAKDKEEKGDPNDKWNWKRHGLAKFFDWVNDRFKSVPKHSGYDTSGLERAIAYLEKLDSEISKAMRSDIDGELDADKIEKAREQIEKGVDSLEERLGRVSKKKKKKADLVVTEFEKTASPTPFLKGTYVTVPLLISSLARTCINGFVSAGHDLRHTFDHCVDEFKLDKREQTELRQLITDMGYTLRFDRGHGVYDSVNTRSSDNYDWNANYQS